VQLWLWHCIQGNANAGGTWKESTIYAFADSPRVTFPPQPSRGILAILTGYAYETEPNKPIITGKTKGPDVITLDPTTLGHLALGASQIPAWHGARNRAGALDDSRQKAG
jgi:hypothetical protein